MHVADAWVTAGDEMQLIMFPNFEPDVSVVVKRIWNDFSADHVAVNVVLLFRSATYKAI